MVKLLSTIHISFLILALLLSLVARFIVGSAGHSSEAGAGDAIVLIYLVVSLTALILYYKIPHQRKPLFIINASLLAVGAITMIYVATLQITEEGEILYELLAPELLFALNAIALIYQLYKSKSLYNL